MPIFIVIIALAAIIGVGGYFYKSETVAPTPVVEVATTPTPVVATSTPEPVVTEPTPVTSAPEETLAPGATSSAATTSKPVATTTPVATPAVKTTFKDGVHTANTSYIAPGQTNHTLAVSITLKNDTVTDVTTTFGGDQDGTSLNYQKRFTAEYKTSVIGKKLSAVALSRVGGASLTTGAFTAALAKISAEAKN